MSYLSSNKRIEAHNKVLYRTILPQVILMYSQL